MRSSILGAIFVAAGLLTAASDSTIRCETRFVAHEDARLTAHFARVLRTLDDRDVSGLTPRQREARLRLLAALTEYAARGVFPRNRYLPDRRVPVFVDGAGRRCAMAYLIETSGHTEMVARIAATANLATIYELADDPGLRVWLNGAGISLDEAALIQPEYGPYPHEEKEQIPRDGVMTAGTVMAVGFGFPAVALNLRLDEPWSRRRQNGVFGLMTGASLLALGLTDAFEDGDLRGTGYIHLTVGGIAATLSLLNLMGGPQRQESAARAPKEHRSVAARVSTKPAARVVIRPGAEGEPQLGVRLDF